MAARRAVNGSAPLVLVVENDESTREMYVEFLAYSGFRVAQAKYADEALEKARTLQPSVITTCIGLQNGDDGCELCQRLKSEDTTRRIPVLVVTAWALGGHVERAKRAGCDAVLLKPCAPTTLVSEIRKYLGADSRLSAL
jgi:CheY-like chemotaxis protein